MNKLVHHLSDPIELRTDFGIPFLQLVKSANYHYVAPNVHPKDFPATRNGLIVATVRLLSFNRKVGINGLLGKMTQLGLIGADPRLLIQLSVDHPEIETCSEIIAPGTIVRQTGKHGGRRLLAFWIGDGKRHLGFSRWGKESWLPGTKYLVEG